VRQTYLSSVVWQLRAVESQVKMVHVVDASQRYPIYHGDATSEYKSNKFCKMVQLVSNEHYVLCTTFLQQFNGNG